MVYSFSEVQFLELLAVSCCRGSVQLRSTHGPSFLLLSPARPWVKGATSATLLASATALHRSFVTACEVLLPLYCGLQQGHLIPIALAGMAVPVYS